MSEWDEFDEQDYQKDLKEFDKFVEIMENRQIDISFNKLQSMEMRANYFLNRRRKSTKSERRLSKDVLTCIAWIKREINYSKGA